MSNPLLNIEIIWDQEARVWIATSDDVPGLATEHHSYDALIEKLKVVIPELLEANGQSITQGTSIAYSYPS